MAEARSGSGILSLWGPANFFQNYMGGLVWTG